MTVTTNRQADVQRQSEALLQQAREAIKNVDVFLREQGIDPEKFRAALPALMTDEMSQEAAQMYAELNREVEREVAQNRRELGLDPAAHAGGKKLPRSTV
ncbi:hypothetical protein [Bordetella sp. 02P26C-1]|uniref:hypothetical protein n=1 Tax=Bordetella sp. 02P26C-1 TaxID=2683195 RepID=UPI0013553EA1|nr:hypothetical protein [Bordetella sp. 02P26C-1]MVW78574.1 hypothetical protein [Bordetella sp. 02P26C-1]